MWKSCVFILIMNMCLILFFSKEASAILEFAELAVSSLVLAVLDLVAIIMLFVFGGA